MNYYTFARNVSGKAEESTVLRKDFVICPVGPVVRDHHVICTDGKGGGEPDQTKRTCQMHERVGGGAPNVARAIRGCGRARPVFLIGSDRRGEDAKQELGDEFFQAVFDHCYNATRQSVILNNSKCYTTRPPMNRGHLLSVSLQAVAEADLTVLAPLSATDFPVAEQVLATAADSLLMLSDDQLADREAARKLFRRANLTVLNEAEAKSFSGCDDPDEGIRALSAAGCRNVVITNGYGAVGWIQGEKLYSPALSIEQAKTELPGAAASGRMRRTTLGAGDCFVGVFAAAWAAGFTPPQALALGQAAAARHVTGLPPLGSLSKLADWAAAQRKVEIPLCVPLGSRHDARWGSSKP